MKKLISILLIAASVLFLLSLCSCGENGGNTTQTTNNSGTKSSQSQQSAQSGEQSSNAPVYAKDGEMKMRIFKIGKDDSILIRTSSSAILIDAGQDAKDAEKIIEYLAEKNITKIDQLIITRFDSSTIGGVPTLLNSVSVAKIIEPSYDKESIAYTEYTAALSAKGLVPEKLTEDRTVSFDDVSLKMCKSGLTSSTDGADSSYCMTVSVTHGNNKFFLCEGSGYERVNDILKSDDLKHDFILMPDHGVFDTNTEALLEAVSPKYAAIIDSSKHPADQATLTALAALDVDFYRTSNGNIKITSDRQKIEIEQGSTAE